jgi:uncharacterized protein YegP (UPF0339 family)
MPHKFKIVSRANGQFGVQFSYNAEIIVWSENYVGKKSAENCIASLKKNVPDAAVVDLTKEETGKGYRFEIVASKDGQTFVRFVASNGETMVRTERYKSKSSAKHAIASVKKNAPGAVIVDETEAPPAKA